MRAVPRTVYAAQSQQFDRPPGGVRHDIVARAIQHTYADPRDGEAVMAFGKYWVMQKAEAERLAAAGVEFAYLFDHDLPDGSNVIVTVPIN